MPVVQRCLALFAGAFTISTAAPAVAEIKWVLPSAVQSPAEQAAPVIRKEWILPTRPAIVRDAAGRVRLTRSDRPTVNLFDHGTVVTSGFGGTVLKTPLVRTGDPVPDFEDPRYLFLDPNGTVVTLLGGDDLGRSFDGTEIDRSPYDRLLARDIGQVFGLAIDDEEFRNLYLTASSAYGLNIVGPDRDNDTLPDRLLIGEAKARWMAGQWGNDQSAGPGSVWKVDGETGQISLLTNIAFEGGDNTGPGLGNIAFDPDHNQLFVSDLQTGMIHRLTLDGRDMQQLDHGAALETPVLYDPASAVEISSDDFDAEDPDSWGFAAKPRRVWGLTVHSGRLFYAVADGPAVYSVEIDKDTGEITGSPRWELTVKSGYGRGEITDMVFTGDGAMVLGRRGERLGAFDSKALTKPRRATVLRYVFEDPEDDQTPSVWVEQPQVYPVGFGAKSERALGGVDVGPAYDDMGKWSSDYCGATLWTTGESLRDEPALHSALKPGGALQIDGLQAQPVLMNKTGNRPPWQAFFADYDRAYDQTRVSGHIGDVEVVGCRGQGGHGEDYVGIGYDYDDDFYDETGGGGGDDDHICLAPPCGKPPKPRPACLSTQVLARCDKASGEFQLVGIFDDLKGQGLDTVKITDPSGQISSLPTEQSLLAPFSTSLGAMVAGQRGQLNLCAFNAADRDSGEPYACCNAVVPITTPTATCEKEAQ